MGFFTTAFIAGLVGIGIHKMRKEAAEQREEELRKEAAERKRKSTPFHFNEKIGSESFRDIVKLFSYKIQRISEISFDGPVVCGEVVSQSGISRWNFWIDFNDYGKLSGKYWIKSENTDSKIPYILANRISDKIKMLYNSSTPEKEIDETISAEQGSEGKILCPYCTQPFSRTNSKFCPHCHIRFRI